MKKFFRYNFSLLFCLMLTFGVHAQYAVGDYGSLSSGNWNASIWGTWNGASWTPVASIPTSLTNAHVLSGRTVVLQSTGSPWSVSSLTIEAGGKLWTANSASNIYVSIYGSALRCDGQIGDGANFDGISFNFEGANTLISGTGAFDASRMRKNSVFNTTTTLTIGMSLNLRWNAASGTQLYNGTANAGVGSSIFNVTINAFCTVNLVPNGPNIGNVAIDGLDGSQVSIFEAGGTFTINGTLIISGKLYLTTNNASATYRCNWVVNGLVQTNEIVASASGGAAHSFALNVGGKLDITGTAAFSSLSTVNNTFNFAFGSIVEYSASGPQLVRVRAEFASPSPANREYGYLILSGSGLKSTNNAGGPDLYVRNDITITGSAILDPNPSASQLFIGGNWINYNQSAFLEKNTVTYFNGGSIQSISCPGGEVFYTLRYAKSATYLQFNNPVDVINQLLLANNGYIDLNSNALTIRNGATNGIQGQSSARYIVSEKNDNSSKIIWKIGTGTGVYVFPFGVTPGGAANYIPVRFAKSTAFNIGDVSLATYGTPPNNLPWPTTPTVVTNLNAFITANNTPDNRDWTVDRFWQVDATNPVSIDSLTFSYRQPELPVNDLNPATQRAQFWAGAYNSWNLIQYGTGVAYNVQVPGFQYFNTAWTITSDDSPLPVELLNFNATPEENFVELSWSTATEINNSYFTVEKSVDGKTFYEIGKIRGAGNSSVTLEYELNDENPVYGISYYRLKQTDFDGQFTYSEIVPVNYRKKHKEFSIFPNPASDNVYIVGEADENQLINILSVDGKLINSFTLEYSKQIHSLSLDELKNGLYIIEIKSQSETQYLRLVKN